MGRVEFYDHTRPVRKATWRQAMGILGIIAGTILVIDALLYWQLWTYVLFGVR